MEYWQLALCFFGIALFYSSVGFGGGSSYLALLALFNIEFKALRLIALVCNIIVVTGSTYVFYKSGFLKLKKIFPLVICSIPLAYLGGRLKISETVFFVLLAISLLLAGIWLLIQKDNPESKEQTPTNNKLNMVFGSGIGFLSGIVGIGGGIFLSPLLHLTHWDKAKIIAATASFFILVNSVAGIAGQLSTKIPDLNIQLVAMLSVSVFLGGQIGSRLSANRINPVVIKRLTGILVLFVALRLFYKYLLVQ